MLPLCFLDANVLAKPFTRTLLLVASAVTNARFCPIWSQRAEDEAMRVLERRFSGRATSLAQLRSNWGFSLSPTAAVSGRFTATQFSDRQILADAIEAGAGIIVTEDVDDFAEIDLESNGVCAIHYDLFAASFLTFEGYESALSVISRAESKRAVHAAVARLHPRVFAKFSAVFPDVLPAPYSGNPPTEIIRGRAQVLSESEHQAILAMVELPQRLPRNEGGAWPQ
ncbi:MAG: hypothetical protein Q4C87_05960 [Actinomycetaceae bacterium]|nr:hypothetical protein [Actinomycetaceae bacterium]